MVRVLLVSVMVSVVAAAGVGTFVSQTARAAEAEKKAAAVFEVYKDKAGEFRWRLRTQNTKVIATSGEGYSSKQSCQDAIESVKKNAADAPVEEKMDAAQ